MATRQEVLAPLLALAEEIRTGPYTCSGKFVRLQRALVAALEEPEPESVDLTYSPENYHR